MIKVRLLLLLCFFPLLLVAQDVIVLKSGQQIACTVTHVDSLLLYYNLQQGNRLLFNNVPLRKVASYTFNNTRYMVAGKSMPQVTPVDFPFCYYIREYCG